MTDLPIDYRDEFQSASDFILETMQVSERFRSFHWVLATDDKQRFAHSSAIVDGPVDMSPLANAKGPAATVRHHLRAMLAFKSLYAVDIRLYGDGTTPKDVLASFSDKLPNKLIVMTASGQRLAEGSPWTFSLAFFGLDEPEAFLKAHVGKLAATKPLIGGVFFSKRDKHG